MNKGRLLLSAKKQHAQQLEAENDNGNLGRVRSSRSAKSAKHLLKTAPDYFRIRTPLNVYMIEKLNELGRKTYFQKVFLLALNIEDAKLNELGQDSHVPSLDVQQPDFRKYAQGHLDDIFVTCERNKSTADHLSGLFLAMGRTHTFLMIEGAEDMIANFFYELDLVHDRLWSNSRVFLVEDKIAETYFNCFYSGRSPTINLNATFPSSTPKDHNLMAVHHLKMKEKAKHLVQALSTQMKRDCTQYISKDSSAEPLDLTGESFSKLLPELQRMDFVLSASKFYRTVKDFALTYRVLQVHQDEDSFFWPIQDNYTPLQIFQRSKFDVNLTFGVGGTEEKQGTQPNAAQTVKELSPNA